MNPIIQTIVIKQTETRDDEAKPYTVYRVDVHGPVRQWHLWKRYSDFTKLNEQLAATFPGVALPAQLPQKRFFPHTISAPNKVEDRRQGLESYLKVILTGRDDRWRKTDIWLDFLSIPVIKQEKPSMSSGAWLEEHDDMVKVLREVRATLNNRIAHQNRNEVSEAAKCEMEAKKALNGLNSRLSGLETSLNQNTLPDGEQTRRWDKLTSLKQDHQHLMQMALAQRHEKSELVKPRKVVTPPPPPVENNGDIGFQSYKAAPTPKPTSHIGRGRAFGAALKQQLETEETRGLDNQQLLEYQNQLMADQDSHMDEFTSILARQKELGMAISHELDAHVEVLDDLDSQTQKTQTKLHFANKKMRQIK
jgi:regulator of vacuolar morphogenesis